MIPLEVPFEGASTIVDDRSLRYRPGADQTTV